MDLLGIASKTFFFISLLPFLIIQSSNALVPSTYINYDCSTGSYDPSDENSLSINSLLSDLIHHSSNSSFYSSKSGAGENTTYGFFYCTADVNSQDCNSCVQSAANDSQSYCQSYRAAVVFYRECTLRYSDTPLYGQDDEYIAVWEYSSVPVSYKQFNKTLYSTLDAVITQAANGPDSKGFATGEAKLVGTKERLYTFAQCTPDILGSACENCLRATLGISQDCCDGSRWGPQRTYLMIFYPSCQVRHEVRNPSSRGLVPSSLSSASVSLSPPGKNVWFIILVLVAAAIALL